MHRALMVGLSTLDVIHSVDRLPHPNQKSVALDFAVAAGGPAAGAAVASVAAGVPATVITCLPHHPLSTLIMEELAGVGVGTELAGAYPGPPVTASILVTAGTGERAVVSPTSAAGQATLDNAWAPALGQVTAVLLDGHLPEVAVRVAQQAQAQGIPVLFDGGSHKPHTEALLPLVDVAVVSADFCPPGTSGDPQQVWDYLASHGIVRMAITRGADPVLYRWDGVDGQVPVPPTRVVDTLGAGDVFHGALTAHVAKHGLASGSPEASVAYAAQVAALSVSSFGTRAWLEGQVPQA